MPVKMPLIAATAALLLAACADRAQSQPAQSAGKRAAPVELHVEVPAHLAAGVPITVNVDAVSGIDADELQLSWVPSAGLVLGATPNPAVIPSPAAGQHRRQSVSLTAAVDGEYFLGIVATLRAAGSTQTRSISARINVGTIAPKAKSAPSGEAHKTPIESMPAQETIPR